MASNKNSSSNRTEVPEARDAMDRFKMEVADELGVNLKQGYNGNITAKEAGSIGGEMVRKMIKKQEEEMAGQSRYKGSGNLDKGRIPEVFGSSHGQAIIVLCI